MRLLNFFKKDPNMLVKMVVLYMSSELNSILIAPQYVDKSWIRYEQEDIEQLDFNCTDESLGEAIKRNFDKFAVKNMPNTKRTAKDWPVYQASKLKTETEFERHYFRISINGANDSNIIMVFEADMKSKHKINATSSISTYAEHQKLGRLAKQLHDIQINRTIE